MLLIPQEKVLLKSKLPANEVCQRLSSAFSSTFCEKTNAQQIYSKSFEGTVNRNHFEIKRLTRFSLKIKPRVKGKVISDLEGSWIEVSMHLQPRTIQLLMMWVLMLGLGGLIALIFQLVNDNLSHMVFIPVIVLPVSVVLVLAIFHHEADQSVTAFKKLLVAKVVKRRR